MKCQSYARWGDIEVTNCVMLAVMPCEPTNTDHIIRPLALKIQVRFTRNTIFAVTRENCDVKGKILRVENWREGRVVLDRFPGCEE